MLKQADFNRGTEHRVPQSNFIGPCINKKLRVKRVMSQEKKYAKISFETRQMLVDLVHRQNYSFKKAADRLNMNQSTARMIVRKYEASGNLF